MRTPALVTIAAVLAAARIAHGECAGPQPAVFPAGGALPPGPTLYRFEPSYAATGAIRVDGPDGPVAFTTRDVSSSDDIRVTAIHLEAGEGPIELRIGDEPVRRYVRSRDAAPAAPVVAPTVDRAVWVQDAWTCSHSEGIAIELEAPGVVAYRARWTGGAEAIVPPTTHGYWGDADGAAAYVFLGHANCVGHQIPPAMIGRRDVTLTAIYADGTSHELALRHEPRLPAATPLPPQRELRRPRAWLAADHDAPAGDDDAAPARWPWIAGLSVASIAFTIALTRRRRRAAVP